MNTYTVGIFGLMLVAGAGIPVMAAMNAQIGLQLQSPIAAVVVLCCVALLSATTLLLTQSSVQWDFAPIPPWYFLSGVLFIAYIGSITCTAPIIGLGNAIFFVLLGQLIAWPSSITLACSAPSPILLTQNVSSAFCSLSPVYTSLEKPPRSIF